MNGVKISDHQQSMAPRPLRGAFLIPPVLLVVADCNPNCYTQKVEPLILNRIEHAFIPSFHDYSWNLTKLS